MIQFYLRIFILMACVVTSWSVKAEKYWLTHCHGELANNASPVIDTKATVSVATLFSTEEIASLVDNSITALRFGLVSKLKLDEVTVWVADDLDKEPLRSVTVLKSDLKSGWNEVNLEKPLVIDGQPLYVGYTFSQPSKCNVISVYTDNGSYPLWLDDGKGWSNVTSDYSGALCVEVGIEGTSLAEYGLEINSVSAEYPVVETGSMAFLRVDFINTGLKPFNNLAYTVNHPSGKVEGVSKTYLVNPREKGSFFINLPLDGISDQQAAVVTITAIEGKQLTDFPVNEVMLTVAEAPYLQRNILLEDFSNESCNNCPAAAVAIEKALASLEEPFRVNLVTHHAGSSYDFFTIEASKEYEYFYTGSKYSPMTMFDRSYVNGEINITPSSEPIIYKCINTELSRQAEASLSFIPFIDTKKGLVEIEAQGTICDKELVNLTLFVAENNVPALHQSGVSGAYLHQAMLRSTGDVWGTPIEVAADGRYRLTTQTMFNNSEWKRDECYLIAFLTDNDPDSPTYRAVLQSMSLPLVYAFETSLENSYIQEINNSLQAIEIGINNNHLTIVGDYTSVKVFTVEGIEISSDCLPGGPIIVKVILTDGHSVTKKLMS